MTDQLSPTADQMALLAGYPHDRPFVMVNLLKYNGAAGAERYLREYEPAVRPIMEAAGGRDVWKGRAEHVIIGSAPHDWDAVWLVRWPSKAAFFAMVTHPDFAATQEIRVASLDAITLLLSSEY
jgi:uncharacterized protein (DUF1330 family)